MTYMHIQPNVGIAVILCILVKIFHVNKLKFNGKSWYSKKLLNYLIKLTTNTYFHIHTYMLYLIAPGPVVIKNFVIPNAHP